MFQVEASIRLAWFKHLYDYDSQVLQKKKLRFIQDDKKTSLDTADQHTRHQWRANWCTFTLSYSHFNKEKKRGTLNSDHNPFSTMSISDLARPVSLISSQARVTAFAHSCRLQIYSMTDRHPVASGWACPLYRTLNRRRIRHDLDRDKSGHLR